MSPSEPDHHHLPSAERDALRRRLNLLILGDQRELTGQDVVEQAGVDPELAQRLWRAIGFPDAGDTAAYSEQDVQVLTAIDRLQREGALPTDALFQLVRAIGHLVSRLADWQISVIVDAVEGQVSEGRASTRLEAAVDVATDVVPTFDEVLRYAWRRHLAASAARVEALGEADSELLSTRVTVGFADLSRFTKLSNELDEIGLAKVVQGFENHATDIVAARGGRVIKTLGDAVLFTCPDPRTATTLSLELVRQIGARKDLPDVRVGLATGSVISRLGDVFGPPVNLAARMSAVARANRVLVDQETAKALTDDEFEARPLPARPLRGFGLVTPVAVSRRRTFRAH